MGPADKTFQDALVALNGRNLPEAERLFRAGLNQQPGNVRALNLLTVILMSMGRFAEAEPFVARAVGIDQTSDVSYYNYGVILGRLDRPEQAIEQFGHALRLNPATLETWNNRGTAFNKLRLYERAIADFDRAIALDRNYFAALYNKGKSLAGLERYQEALAAYDRALALEPDLAEGWFASARCHVSLRQDHDALSCYNRFFSLQREANRKRALGADAKPVEHPGLFGHDDGSAATRQILETLKLLEPRRAVGFDKIRLGSAADGGYVQLDDLRHISRAFSLGVSTDDNWDIVLALKGIAVEQYDHSIASAPTSHPLLTFNRKRISAVGSDDCVSLGEVVARHARNDTADLILKIDIEGDEWDVFDQAEGETLARFAQIVCEFHHLFQLRDERFHARARRVFTKLAGHFSVVHVHANNYGAVSSISGNTIPDTLEVTYASRARYTFEAADEEFPTPLDAASNPLRAEIKLGTFRF
jgi:tetratricopeptide (TPR) repeat protein